MKKLILLPALLIALSTLAQTKLTIQLSGEGSGAIDKKMSSDSFPGPEPFRVYVQDNDVVRSFILFDMSSIPVGSKVNWARLSLFCAVSDGGQIGYNSSKLRRITSPWIPGRVTWKTQPSTTNRSDVSLANSTNGDEDYKNINVTNLVQTMVDSPSTSFGFALKLDTETVSCICIDRVMEFYSPAMGKPHRNPKLVIEYTPPGVQKQEVTTMSEDLNGSSAEMNIHPNPCNGIFNCNIKSTETDNMTLRVIDMLGRTVFNQSMNTSNFQTRINLPTSSAGTYFVILQNNKNETLISQQLQVN